MRGTTKPLSSWSSHIAVPANLVNLGLARIEDEPPRRVLRQWYARSAACCIDDATGHYLALESDTQGCAQTARSRSKAE